jgi:hypothetical protein
MMAVRLLLLAAVVVVVAACGRDDGDDACVAGVNRSDRQIRVYLGPSEAPELSPSLTSARASAYAAGVRQLAARLDGATVLALHSAVQPGARAEVKEGDRAGWEIRSHAA